MDEAHWCHLDNSTWKVFHLIVCKVAVTLVPGPRKPTLEVAARG